jgi:GNAT superfamily N-acetyltransferase
MSEGEWTTQKGVTIRTDIRPGDLGALTALHGRLYAQEYSWDCTFEAYVAQSLAEMVLAGDSERHRLWLVEHQGAVAGSIGIVGREHGEAQLRWFLLHPASRGHGLGRDLIARALAFCRAKGYRSVFLWTVKDLVQAAALYTAAGFHKTEEITHELWGQTITEERYDLLLLPSAWSEQASRPAGPGVP